ncbi:MAG: Flp pilus assembly complex ATPase component TadA [Candidatus Peribacteria bacterium]|nr:MAG: Flp pilus assembly complex ATPase component TadA [Candidatus Peribacteria bacterium]
MVGEIRTLETADMAINAALTGHLVISTIHTNTAVEAINRLLNMGIKPFMLAASLNLVVGQRLVRKVTDGERIAADPMRDAEIQELLNDLAEKHPDMASSYQGKVLQAKTIDGSNTQSYAGRTAVMETLTIDEQLKLAILEGKSSAEITALAQAQGYITMRQDPLVKILNGETSIEEIERVF